MAFLSWRHLELGISGVRVDLLLAGYPFAFLALLMTTYEYRFSKILLGSESNWREEVSVSIFGSLANILPLPGGAMVRIVALRRHGIAVRKSSKCLASVALIWVALSSGVTAVVIFINARFWVAAGVGAAGIMAFFVAITLIWTLFDRPFLFLTWFITLEMMVIAVTVIRNYLVIRSVGLDASFFQAMGLVAASSLAVAMGVVPAGIGVREVLSGLIGSQIDLDFSSAVIISSVNQFISLTTLFMGYLLVRLLFNRDFEKIRADKIGEDKIDNGEARLTGEIE